MTGSGTPSGPAASNTLKVIEQITYLLFLRRLDELQELEERKAQRLKAPIVRRFFPEGADGDEFRNYVSYRGKKDEFSVVTEDFLKRFGRQLKETYERLENNLAELLPMLNQAIEHPKAQKRTWLQGLRIKRG